MHSQAPSAWQEKVFTTAWWGTWEQSQDSISVNMFTEIESLLESETYSGTHHMHVVMWLVDLYVNKSSMPVISTK